MVQVALGHDFLITMRHSEQVKVSRLWKVTAITNTQVSIGEGHFLITLRHSEQVKVSTLESDSHHKYFPSLVLRHSEQVKVSRLWKVTKARCRD